MKEKIVYSDIFKSAWKGFLAQIWLLTGLVIGFTIIFSLLILFVIPDKGEVVRIGGLIVSILCICLGSLFSLGYLRNCMQTLDGEEPQFSAYGQESRKLLSFLVAYILFSVIITVGFALFIFPGVYLFLRFQFFFASMVDEDTGLITSFKRSWEMTKGYQLQLLVLLFIHLLIFLIGMMALCIGVFAAIPLSALLYGSVYRKLTAPVVQ